jgi:predicted small integral membrane protein
MDIVGLELGFLLWQVSQTNRVAASGGKWLFFWISLPAACPLNER